MAIPRRFPIPSEVAFSHGLYQISEVEKVIDYDKSSKENKVQQLDKETGLPLWQVICLDADPEAKKAQKTVTVKIAAKVQPVPPENKDGSPFTPVEFEGLMAQPWVEEQGDFSKVSWSFRAEGITAPRRSAGKPAGSAGDKPAAGEKAVA